ncbi:TonB-dependent receptor [Sphingomonas desiccabilis]|uniref:TonB-dependent receptor n=1 Tax=Sphingomonas desiccabilis TaxID=429134 RepID=A0A4Q2IP88_9SPHN|nr:TonB-dependent receptor [Sphingomonas desiccabilis]MBB3911805.1 iron complex outermembrane receptor protein [Sphingomonas desiccabilis]RXZ31476.1 TonB-dependent receptor [Sphingomonas desiccabilis]
MASRPFFLSLRLSLMVAAASAMPALAEEKPTPAAAAGVPDPDSPAADEQVGSDVVVTARNRGERVQNVPIPITVVSGEEIDRLRLDTIKDYALKVPNLLVNAPNARQSSIAIRGLGKNTANDGMEASVGLIVDNVFAGHVGMSWVNYVDVDRIELLRGPQGTLLGKNTTLGVLNITTRGPSFEPGATAEISVGSRDSILTKASVTGPINNWLAFRASAYYDKRDGFLDNPQVPGESFLGVNRGGARLQLLAKPGDGFSARIIAEYFDASERINTRPPRVDPATFADGTPRSPTYGSRLARDWFAAFEPIYGSFDRLALDSQQPLETRQYGLSAELNWTLGDHTLTSISAYRRLDFDAKNDTDYTPFNIVDYNGTLLKTQQVTQEIRFASPSGADVPIDYQVGLFFLHSGIETTSRQRFGSDAGAFYASGSQYGALNATAEGRAALGDALDGVGVLVAEQPRATSVAAFGQLNWHVTPRATLTLGIRDTQEWKNNDIVKSSDAPLALDSRYGGAILTTAQAIRAGRVRALYATNGREISDNAVSWLVSPSYRLSEDVLLYASAARGEKSGAVQVNEDTGAPQNVAPERVLDYELGIKSQVLDRALTLNLNLYRTNVSDYQAVLSTIGADNSVISYLGNVGRVRMQGAELEGALRLSPRATISFAGAYNDAIYRSFTNAPCALEVSNVQAICDFSGRPLAGASKWTGNIGFDGFVPVGRAVELYANWTTGLRSDANLNSSLSLYGIQKGYALTNGSIGIRAADGRWDLGLWARNLFDEKYVTDVGSASGNAAFVHTLGERRLIGVSFRGRI